MKMGKRTPISVSRFAGSMMRNMGIWNTICRRFIIPKNLEKIPAMNGSITKHKIIIPSETFFKMFAIFLLYKNFSVIWTCLGMGLSRESEAFLLSALL
jgi:hypothetical protein